VVSLISTIKGLNVVYIRKMTHIHNASRFWMEMWCPDLLLVRDIGPVILSLLPGLPNIHDNVIYLSMLHVASC